MGHKGTVLCPLSFMFMTDLSYGHSFFFRLFVLNLALQILCSLKNKTLSTFTIVLMYDIINQDYL